MSLLNLKNLVDERKTISFYLTPEDMQDKGKYVCEISSSDDEHLLFGNSIESLLSKLERRDVQLIPKPKKIDKEDSN